MSRKIMRRALLLTAFALACVLSLRDRSSLAVEPIRYRLRGADLENHLIEVEAEFPSATDSLELMMPIWSPGFYRIEDYAAKVKMLAAKNSEGASLEVKQPRGNRWTIATGATPRVTVTYQLLCDAHSVTQNWASKELLVLNGPATFITMADDRTRPSEVRLELAPTWTGSASGLNPASDGNPNHYMASDYDNLVDSPIVAGTLAVSEFKVGQSRHFIVEAGDYHAYDRKMGAASIEKMVAESEKYWGTLPFDRYVFLNVFRRGGGGLEHANSTLLTSSPNMKTPSVGWLSFVAHEYVHAFNVKRLRPIELSRLDYERPPSTSSLWISEGLTTYIADLIVARAGLCDTPGFLGLLSSHIGALQMSPGRLKQTLDQASLEVWTSGTSGVVSNPQNAVSYYVKGPVVGFVLDAKIQKATSGAKSLDDVMRLAYARYSGERGFSPEEFCKTAEEVAGVELKPHLNAWLASTQEIDYAEALDWFGLQFAINDRGEQIWKLQMRPDATEEQSARLRRWLQK